jgi:hypothetical protein
MLKFRRIAARRCRGCRSSRRADQAWLEIAGNFGTDPLQIEAARLRLAEAVLSVANEDSRDAGALKRAALQRMALDYRDT